ncbi:MAG: hypothetical protein GC190_20220 [Alphaproteobacteria bacterium]|nr:hypothetical protein [Alphaproteobacteria bacterium]
MRAITVTDTYPVTPKELWAQVVRYDSLQAMMSGPLVRVRCPVGEERAGHDVALTFRLFGVVPIGRWRFKVIARDDERLRLVSDENGTGVRLWRHQIDVVAEGSGSRLTDSIAIDAGALTPLVVAFARRDYARRHRLRKGLLARATT